MFGLDFLNGSLNFSTILLLIWALVWKGWALWKAGRRGQRNWFVAILIINTLGILEIIYIFVVARKAKPDSLEAGSKGAADEITFDEFKRLDLRVGTILQVDEVKDSKKLIKLLVNLGKEKRQIIAGIKEYYEADDLIGQQITVVANLQPKELMGNLSHGMLLAADNSGEAVLLHPGKDVPLGSQVN